MLKNFGAKVLLLYETRKFLTWEKTWDFAILSLHFLSLHGIGLTIAA
jgi:hypothetical protein